MKSAVIIASVLSLGTCLLNAEQAAPKAPTRTGTATTSSIDKATNKPLVNTKKRSQVVAHSTLLSDGKHWTLVPKGSVIHVPSRYRSKIVSKPTGKLIEWKDFLRRNHGWLQAMPVSARQALGKEKIDAKSKQAHQSMGKLVVATCNNNPISLSKQRIPPGASKNR